MKTIEIANIGPIERLSIPLPEAGVVVLRGRNGVGKSHALAAVDSLISGRGKPPCRDGTARGEVQGFGAKLTIGRSTRRTGEAEVITLEGRLDISQLVQPPIKDEEAADRQRIKALIQLSDKPADRTTFRSILPENLELDELVSPYEEAEDPVVFAGKLKRALEAEARRWEKVVEENRAQLSVIEKELGNAAISCDDERWFRLTHHPDVVRAEAEMAVAQAMSRVRELEARQEMAAQQAAQIAEVRKALHELEGGAVIAPEKIDAELAELDEKIRKLEQALSAAKERRAQLLRRREEAARIQQQIAELRRIVSTLERLATALYVTRLAKEGASVEERAQQLTTLKPHISLLEAKTAIEEVDQIIREAKERLHS